MPHPKGEFQTATHQKGFAHDVFAHWYTVTLRCPQGALLKYVHGGFRSVYEEDLFLEVSKGAVANERLVRNGTAAPDALKGYLTTTSGLVSLARMLDIMKLRFSDETIRLKTDVGFLGLAIIFWAVNSRYHQG